MFPKETNINIYLGNLYFDKDSLKESFSAYKLALENGSLIDGADGIRNIAYNYYNSGRLEEAMECYKVILKQIPGDPTTTKDLKEVELGLFVGGR